MELGLGFVLIFVVFILLNAVAALVQKRNKQKAAVLQAGEKRENPAEAPRQTRSVQPAAGGESPGSERSEQGLPQTAFLEEQNVNSLLAARDIEVSYPRQRPQTFRAQRQRRSVERPAAASQRAQSETASPFADRLEKAHALGSLVEAPQREKQTMVTGTTTGYVASPALRGSGWERVQNLPPLQRAVVLLEIIGKPKAYENQG
jgi:hypothetical protein